MLKRLFYLLVLALCAPAPLLAYPTKPVRFIVPFPPGGGADLVARVVGQGLTALWAQQVIVDNRPGAGANIAGEIAAAAAPDGYTLFQFNIANAIAPSVHKKLRYDPLRDFAGVTQLAATPFILLAHPAVKASTVQELIALARSAPGKLSYASSGIGGSTHLLGELFKTLSRTDIVHVPYKGAGPGVTDLMSGRVQLMFVVPAAALRHVASGKLRALGVSSAQRTPLAPEVPTIAETGLAGFDGGAWYGVVVPAKTPHDTLAKLSRDIRHVLQQRDVKDVLTRRGIEIVGSTPAEFTSFIKSEIGKWRRAATAAGIVAQ